MLRIRPALGRLLTRDPACGPGARFELAVTGLKVSNKSLSHEERGNDPCLGQFARLLQDPSFDVVARLAKLKWLDPEDLFYLGFHFVEQNHREREFGKSVLETLIKRSPRSAVAKDARQKLKSEALV